MHAKMGEPETALQPGRSHPVWQFYEVVQEGYKCPRCGGRELVGLKATKAMKHLKARNEAEYAELMKALSHRKQPVKRNAPLTTLEESWRMSASVTVDIWSGKCIKGSFFAATIHHVEDGSPKNAFLGLKRLNGRHDAQTIKRGCLKIVNSVGINDSSIYTVATEPGANIVCAFKNEYEVLHGKTGNTGCEEVPALAVSISSDEDDNASTCSDGDLFDSGEDEIDDFEEADRKLALAGGLKASGCRAQVDALIGVVRSQNPLKSKPWESLIGCLIPLLALLTSTGVISAMGIKFQSIVVASLFLVLSVGVDDVFIILRAWDRTDMNAEIHVRLAKTLEDAGPSITIRCVPNLLNSLESLPNTAQPIANLAPAIVTHRKR
ncbi:Patched domain-containing protein 3 [Toxocara canis]|uniref:Patched domain-containing protein 3 n=1 Tax=Toxocara canis TaxID=6265 RepID=A0A0B2VXG3_TOXCA|nr:Patched domain-containing protein 3 [Toxocara canis]